MIKYELKKIKFQSIQQYYGKHYKYYYGGHLIRRYY